MKLNCQEKNLTTFKVVSQVSTKDSPLKTNPRISKVAFFALTAFCVLFAAGLAASGAFVASPFGTGLMIGSVVLLVFTVAFQCLKKKSSGEKEFECSDHQKISPLLETNQLGQLLNKKEELILKKEEISSEIKKLSKQKDELKSSNENLELTLKEMKICKKTKNNLNFISTIEFQIEKGNKHLTTTDQLLAESEKALKETDQLLVELDGFIKKASIP